MTIAIYALDVVVSFVCLFLFKQLSSSRRSQKYPPGPPGIPVLGNVADVPKEHAWKAFADLAKKYGNSPLS
jgi:hypothetical protein